MLHNLIFPRYITVLNTYTVGTHIFFSIRLSRDVYFKQVSDDNKPRLNIKIGNNIIDDSNKQTLMVMMTLLEVVKDSYHLFILSSG